VILEPGRTIAANSGVLLTTVRYLKTSGDRPVAVVDAGMTHMVRAAMYESYHLIWPLTPMGGIRPPSRGGSAEDDGLVICDVAGPICETSDYLAKGRGLPPLCAGDVLAVFTVGAYGMTMASNYNSQPRPAEALVDGARTTLIRRRESYEDLVAPELSSGSPLLARFN
jgi:diaminopimelate decarboxylase